VSDAPLWACICEREQSITLDPITLCSPLASEPTSPIDNFYNYVAAVIPIGGEEDLRKNDALGKVLLLGVVSASEHFFRAVLAGLVYICPLVRKKAESLTLSLGAVEYYAKPDLGLALFEHVSLATAGEIQKQTQRLIG
jgi:hypothetical protein